MHRDDDPTRPTRQAGTCASAHWSGTCPPPSHRSIPADRAGDARGAGGVDSRTLGWLIVVDEWLKRIGAYQCSPLFAKHGIDDFFCLPFLRPEVLEKMEIVSPEDKIIMDEVLKLRNMDSAACTLRCMRRAPEVVAPLLRSWVLYGTDDRRWWCV